MAHGEAPSLRTHIVPTNLPRVEDRDLFPDPQNAKEAIANGMLLLDTTMPGWRQLISVRDIDIHDEETCIIGQLFARVAGVNPVAGPYFYGLYALGFSEFTRLPHDFGFTEHQLPVASGTWALGLFSFAELNQAWKEALAA